MYILFQPLKTTPFTKVTWLSLGQLSVFHRAEKVGFDLGNFFWLEPGGGVSWDPTSPINGDLTNKNLGIVTYNFTTSESSS